MRDVEPLPELHFVLDLNFSDGRPTGSIRFGSESPIEFAGWLSLMAEITRHADEPLAP